MSNGTLCPACSGTGRCQRCRGEGACARCRGTRLCPACSGTGRPERGGIPVADLLRRLVGARVVTWGQGVPPERRVVAEYRLNRETGVAVCVRGTDTMLNFQAERVGIPIHGGLARYMELVDLVAAEFGLPVVPGYFKPAAGRRFLIALAMDGGSGVELIFDDDGGAMPEGT